MRTSIAVGDPMRNLTILLVVLLCSGCARLPAQIIPNAKQAQAVVFDIDATLTPAVYSIFVEREDAAKAVRIFADKGYKIIYLSARFKWFQSRIPGWLAKHGFPEGSLQLSQTDEDDKHPGDFKTRVLKGFIARGWNIQFAYGDSSTDFKAYADVKIPKERVFALLRDGETVCQGNKEVDWNACLKGWTEHLDFVRNSVQSVPAN